MLTIRALFRLLKYSQPIAGMLACIYCSTLFAHSEELDWHALVISARQGVQTHLNISRVYLGASNVNYHLRFGENDCFIRLAPFTTEALYASQEIEYDVLKALEPLNICAKPLYFEKEQRALITEFIPHHEEDVDLLDPKIQRSICQMLHLIEKANIEISRVFHPYTDILQILSHAEAVCNQPLPKELYETFLPALQQIDYALSLHPRKGLCHLDLHHKNILEDDNRLWLIDWEYSAMSHPYLTLASMASIERWSDAQMFLFLSEYTSEPTTEDMQVLYLYRIIADLFWTVWNHVQETCSSIRNPYAVWGELFYQAARERLFSPQWKEAVEQLLIRYQSQVDDHQHTEHQQFTR